VQQQSGREDPRDDAFEQLDGRVFIDGRVVGSGWCRLGGSGRGRWPCDG
jgi:hypothetical protein